MNFNLATTSFSCLLCTEDESSKRLVITLFEPSLDIHVLCTMLLPENIDSMKSGSLTFISCESRYNTAA